MPIVLVPIAASVIFYAIFISRTIVHFGGRTYFVLFDDAMISMRYAENLAHGHGLVYNAGAPAVEGYTNLLWTLYMAFIQLFPISPSRTSLVIELTGIVLLIGCGLLAAAIARLLVPSSRAVAALALISTLFFYPLVFWTLRGMETGLATLLVSALVLQTLRVQESFSTRRVLGAATLAALAVLVRDDLVLPVAVILGYGIWCVGPERRRGTALMLLSPVSGTLAAHEAFRLAYYGNALPNTYYLKVNAPLPTRLTRGVYSLASMYTLTLFAPVALAASALASRLRKLDPRLLLLAGVVLTCVLYDLYVGGDTWEDLRFADRFVTTAAPLLLVLAAIGVHQLATATATAVRSRRTRVVIAMMALAVPLALLPGGKLLWWLSDAHWGSSSSAITGRLVPPLVAIAAIVMVMALRRLGPRWLAAAPVITLTAGLIVTTALPNLRPYEAWRSSNAQYFDANAAATEVGVALRSVTRPGDSIAVVAAGELSYFSERTTIDLLGVNDSHIAHEKPKTAQFHPGHTNWDYRYSIGTYRPTIVVQLYSDPGGIGAQTLAQYGYMPATLEDGGAQRAGDPAPSDFPVYVSREMAARLKHSHAIGGHRGPIKLVLAS